MGDTMHFQAIMEHHRGCCKVKGFRLSDFRSSPIPLKHAAQDVLSQTGGNIYQGKQERTLVARPRGSSEENVWFFCRNRIIQSSFHVVLSTHSKVLDGQMLISYPKLALLMSAPGPVKAGQGACKEGCKTWKAKAVWEARLVNQQRIRNHQRNDKSSRIWNLVTEAKLGPWHKILSGNADYISGLIHFPRAMPLYAPGIVSSAQDMVYYTHLIEKEIEPQRN